MTMWLAARPSTRPPQSRSGSSGVKKSSASRSAHGRDQPWPGSILDTQAANPPTRAATATGGPNEVGDLQAQPQPPKQPGERHHRVEVHVIARFEPEPVRDQQVLSGLADPREVAVLVGRSKRGIGASERPSFQMGADEQRHHRRNRPQGEERADEDDRALAEQPHGAAARPSAIHPLLDRTWTSWRPARSIMEATSARV
jgi:hypothetical protein